MMLIPTASLRHPAVSAVRALFSEPNTGYLGGSNGDLRTRSAGL